jgi:hypothetical protein
MKISNGLILLYQLIFTFLVLFAIYMIYALLDVIEIDLIAGIGFMVFQPILGIVMTSLTIIICMIIGLPIRLINTINHYWKAKPFLSIVGTITGFVLLFLSFGNKFTELKEVMINNETILKKVPNITIALTGWFLIAFSLLHFYPQSLFKLLKRRLSSKPNKANFVVLFFLFLGFKSHSQIGCSEGGKYIVQGKVIHKLPKVPDCGLFSWSTVVEFQIIKIVGINYPGKNIGIIVQCPELYGKGFLKKGKVYEVVFSDKNQSNLEFIISKKELLKKNAIAFQPFAVSINKLP